MWSRKLRGNPDSVAQICLMARSFSSKQRGKNYWILVFFLVVYFLVVWSSTASRMEMSRKASYGGETGGAVTPLFDADLIPENTVVDMNIGTNYDPLVAMEGRHRILVDPLFYVCDSNAKWTTNVTAFCFAVSNQTTYFTNFLEYNEEGVSSSLSKVSEGTSHALFPVISQRTVLVLEANVLFSAIYDRNTTIHRLMMDMQGWELSSLRNFYGLLKKPRFVSHIKAECFCPRNGKQIYQIDNSCEKVSQLLKEADYETRRDCSGIEWGDVLGYKKGMGLNFLDDSSWEGKRPN